MYIQNRLFDTMKMRTITKRIVLQLAYKDFIARFRLRSRVGLSYKVYYKGICIGEGDQNGYSSKLTYKNHTSHPLADELIKIQDTCCDKCYYQYNIEVWNGK